MTMRPPGRRRIVTAAAYRSRINDNSLWDLIINPPRYWFYRLGWPRPEIEGGGGGEGCYNWDRETWVGLWGGVVGRGGSSRPPPRPSFLQGVLFMVALRHACPIT